MSPPRPLHRAGRARATSVRGRPPAARRRSLANRMAEPGDEASLLDILDHVLHKGVVLRGELTIGLAQVDLIYARLSVLLCAAERVLPAVSPSAARPVRTPRTPRTRRPKGRP